jgi:hypothetical protein
MQQSSESIARLAAALAKAQAKLVNPEKSLTATIYPDGADKQGRSFNYASLASGLEIVRKTLSQHAIAAVQTTAIDEATQIVKLTTVLAHSSGEWIASDWPVCSVAETTTPHRMRAALTYARRYALFTLVGIAGEDDLDAPDLQTPTTQTPKAKRPSGAGNGYFQNEGKPFRGNWQGRSYVPTQILPPNESAALRDRLLAEIDKLCSADDAALWALRHLPEKNKLAATNAHTVEEAFAAKLTTFAATDADQAPTMGARKARRNRSNIAQRVGETLMNDTEVSQHPERSSSALGIQAKVATRLPQRPKQSDTIIDKSVLALPEPRRIRDRDHVKYVATQACLICGRCPSDAHHLRFAQSRALGRKVSDEFTVPLCRGHHREVHRCNDEPGWWNKAGIDSIDAAHTLWIATHPLPASSVKIKDAPAHLSPDAI